MTSRTRTGLLAVLSLIVLGLPGLGCNQTGKNPKMGEALIVVTGTGVTGNSAADVTADVEASIGFTVFDRNTSTTSNVVLNGVKFTSFTVAWDGGLFPPAAGIPDDTFFQIGDTGSFTIAIIPAGVKPPAGTVDTARFSFMGEDVIGRPVEFNAKVPVEIVP